ncbi:2143_t:CDS:2 [Ambispora leptoticha]|uniref:2143_t:CDS:1 n=1 Tax=Ambispora leptoticha TaxID=144679 RepID=A0A9N8ZFP1_9GLOM|nr:2143_t:CDS:2 [Ambispora leptoticha]
MAIATPIPKLKRDGAEGIAKDTSGVLSGNVIQVPVKVVACGNTVSLVGPLNQAAVISAEYGCYVAFVANN